MSRGRWLLIGGFTAAWLAVGASLALTPDWDRWQELDAAGVAPAAGSWQLAQIRGTCRDAEAPGKWETCSRSWTVQQPGPFGLEQDLLAGGWRRDPRLSTASRDEWVRAGTPERIAVERPAEPADYPVLSLRESGACRSILDRWRIARTGGRCT